MQGAGRGSRRQEGREAGGSRREQLAGKQGSRRQGREASGSRQQGREAGGGSREQTAGKQGGRREQLAGKQGNLQNSLGEKLLLEQAMARVAGGQTGLLMALDMLLHDAEEKDSAGFFCHAEGYLRRAEKLEPLFARYRGFAGQSTEAALYGSLLKVGRNLRKKLSAISPEGLSDKDMDTWRRSVLRHMELYGGGSPAGSGGPEEGHGHRDMPGG